MKFSIIVLLIEIICLLFTNVSFAQENVKLLGYDLGCEAAKPPSDGGCGIKEFLGFVRYIIGFLLKLAFPLATIFIVYGAFVIITAAGSPDKLKQGKGIIYAAVIGITIALGSWLIVTTVFKVLTGLK